MADFSDPFEVLFSIQRALDARKASNWMGSGATGMGSFPPINIFQQGDDFVAIVELPGVDKNDLGIDVKENTIRISGKKTINYDAGISWSGACGASSTERCLYRSRMSIAEHRASQYRDGVLALFIPRAESDKPRTIKIN